MRRKPDSLSRLPTPAELPVGATTAVYQDAAGPLVLLADGDPGTRAARESQLRAAGFRVAVARTGFEAIVKASCHVPALILIVDSLGDIEAADTARLIVTCPVTAHIPVIRIARGRRVPRALLSALRRVAV